MTRVAYDKGSWINNSTQTNPSSSPLTEITNNERGIAYCRILTRHFKTVDTESQWNQPNTVEILMSIRKLITCTACSQQSCYYINKLRSNRLYYRLGFSGLGIILSLLLGVSPLHMDRSRAQTSFASFNPPTPPIPLCNTRP
jgi:hypothetical protein